MSGDPREPESERAPSSAGARSATSRPRRCRGCSVDLEPGAVRCDRCGAMQRDDVRCPLCGAAASTSPDRELRNRCDVCGGPRLPVTVGVTPSPGAVSALKRADAARKGRAKWRAAAVLGGVTLPPSVLLFGLLLLGFGFSLGLLATALVVLSPLAILTALSVRRARDQTKLLIAQLDEAWTRMAADVARQSKGPLTAESLARALGVEEPQAEELLALLDASDVVRSDITDEGQIVYEPKLRVRPSGGSRDEVTEADILAETEALAEAEAEPERAARRQGGGAGA